ncbi:polysaccharide biosynthesis/export family protein [soil metagenome]
MRRLSTALFAMLGWLAVLACAPAAAQADPQTVAATQPSAVVPIDLAYHLGSGDKVRIIVFGESALTGEFVVSGTGTIALPLVGEIAAKGMTPTQLQSAVESSLREGYLKEPRVSVEILNYRPFYILGEVTKPGEYPYTNGLTVMNAVATANGFTYRADSKHVFIRRTGDTAEKRYDLSTSTAVAPGDTIRIGERYF